MTVTKPYVERTDKIIVNGHRATGYPAENGVSTDLRWSAGAEPPSHVRGLPSTLARLELGSEELLSEGQLIEIEINHLSRNYTTEDDKVISHRLATFSARTRQLRESDADLIAVMNSLMQSKNLDRRASTQTDMTNMRLNAMATSICLANAVAYADFLAQKLRAAQSNGAPEGGFRKKIAKLSRRAIAFCACNASTPA